MVNEIKEQNIRRKKTKEDRSEHKSNMEEKGVIYD